MDRQAEFHSYPNSFLFIDPAETIRFSDGTVDTVTSFELACQTTFIRCATLEDYLRAMSQIVGRLGFTDCSFTRMSMPEIEHRMFTTPEAVTDHYRIPEIGRNDLVLRYCSESTKPIQKSMFDRFIDQANFDIKDLDLLRTNIETRGLLESYGYHDYYNVPIRATNGNGNVMLAVTAKGVPVDHFSKLVANGARALEILARVVDHVATKRIPREFLGQNESRAIHFEPRTLSLLRLIAEGLTAKEASEELKLSVPRIDQLLKQIRDVLGARNNVQAVTKAFRCGLLR